MDFNFRASERTKTAFSIVGYVLYAPIDNHENHSATSVCTTSRRINVFDFPSSSAPFVFPRFVTGNGFISLTRPRLNNCRRVASAPLGSYTADRFGIERSTWNEREKGATDAVRIIGAFPSLENDGKHRESFKRARRF